MTNGALLGLSQEEAEQRLKSFGPNTIGPAEKPHWLLRLSANLTHFFALLLWVAAGLALLAGEPALSLAIIAVIIINAAFAFVQEYRAERAVEALGRILPDQAKVWRQGEIIRVNAELLVPGDLILVEAGDRVSADARLVEADQLRSDMSALTGESLPVSHQIGKNRTKSIKADNYIFAGSHIVGGSGRAIIEDTGKRTELGRVASLTRKTIVRKSPLEKEMIHVTRRVAIIALAIGIIFFLGAGILEMSFAERFIFAIGVIVALVPEGLLPSVTLSLALATQRMAGRQAIVKKLSAIEALGETTIICSDKTGTLTTNQMTVQQIWTKDNGLRFIDWDTVSGQGLVAERLIIAGMICNNSQISSGKIIGDPTETALMALGQKESIKRPDWPRLAELPFNSELKAMAVLCRVDGHDRVFAKGAAATIIPRLSADQDETQVAVREMEERGLRVLVLAEASASSLAGGLPSKLDLLGVIGMQDPPRPEASEAINRCQEAGVRLLLVTGDSGRTAAVLARSVGLIKGKAHIIEGEEIANLSDEQLIEAAAAPQAIFARVSPRDKLRIARVLQEQGEVVAMTGDGINDAPALRAADVGVAMGLSGTDVARAAGDVILLDDNIASITAAIEEGRAVYDNIRRFAQYHFSANTAELAAFLLWGLSGGSIPLPLVVMQVLAIDLGSDLLPAIALGSERAEPGVMSRLPRPRNQRLLNLATMARVFGFVGILVALAALISFVVANLLNGFSLTDNWPQQGDMYIEATAATYAAIVFAQVGASLAFRTSRQSVFRIGLFSNRLLIYGNLFALTLLGLIIYLRPLQSIFHTLPLDPILWPLMICWPLLVLLAEEARKLVIRTYDNKKS